MKSPCKGPLTEDKLGSLGRTNMTCDPSSRLKCRSWALVEMLGQADPYSPIESRGQLWRSPPPISGRYMLRLPGAWHDSSAKCANKTGSRLQRRGARSPNIHVTDCRTPASRHNLTGALGQVQHRWAQGGTCLNRAEALCRPTHIQRGSAIYPAPLPESPKGKMGSLWDAVVKALSRRHTGLTGLMLVLMGIFGIVRQQTSS